MCPHQEPTSGLDSTTALQLLELLRTQLATKQNKTIITSIHQPSSQVQPLIQSVLIQLESLPPSPLPPRSLPSPSPLPQMYYMFDTLLLLAKGKVAYFGPAREAMDYFSSVGLHCDLQYNPADYMSESL